MIAPSGSVKGHAGLVALPRSVRDNNGIMKLIAASTVGVTVLMSLASTPVSGCSCATPLDDSVAHFVSNADFVFRGKLIKIEYLDSLQGPPLRRFLATLEVSSVWKGDVGHTIVLHTREPASDCIGFWTDLGKDLVVFANKVVVTRPEPGSFRLLEWTDKVPVGQTIIVPGTCTLTSEVKNAADTMKGLGPPKLARSDH